MRVSTLERRSKDYIAMQGVADMDDQKPEVRRQAKVIISGGRNSQLKIKFATDLWQSIGSPPYVDIVGRPAEGLKIVAGRDIKIQRKPSSKVTVIVAIGAMKIGVNRDKRPVTDIEVNYFGKALLLDKLPPEWCEYKPRVVPPPEPVKVILPDETPEPEKEPERLTVKVSCRNFHKSQYGLFFNVPSELLGQIGDPKRIVVLGTPHHGFRLEPSHEEGVKLNYATGRNVYFQTGMTNRNIDKVARLGVDLEATVKDGIIKIGGCPPDWIKAQGEFKAPTKEPAKPSPTASPPPALASSQHNGTHASNGNGHSHNAANGSAMDGLPKGNTSVEIAAVMARITRTLADVRMLRDELEKRTGLKFKLTSNLTFTLNV